MGVITTRISPHLSGIKPPAFLRPLRGWLTWRYEHIGSEKKPRKIPYYADGSRRIGKQNSPEDKAKMATFEAALRSAIRLGMDGVGLAVDGEFGICIVDFDNCVTENGLDPAIEQMIAGTYAEFSPSGNGVHAFVLGNLGNRKSHGTAAEPIGFELFSSKGFVTFTGNVLEIAELTASTNTVSLPSSDLLAYAAKRVGNQVTDQEVDTPPMGLSEAQVDAVLVALSPDMGHDDWLRVGMGLHHETAGDGFGLWDAWSAQSDKYPGPDVLESRWLSFGQQGDRPVTFRSLLKMANITLGVPESDLDAFEVLPEPIVPPGGHFNIRSLLDFSKQVRRLDYFIKGVLPRGQLAILFGASGAGKSFITLDMCCALALGIPWNNQKVKRKHRVLYVVAEGVNGFATRIKAYCRQHDVDPADITLDIISDIPPNLTSADSVKKLIADIKAQPEPYDLIVMDTFAQVTPGANENSGEDMGLALAHCRALHNASGAMVLLVHHSGKDASQGARGHSSIRAAADVELEVCRFNDLRSITVTKLKDGMGEGEEYGFNLVNLTLEVDDEGDEITSCYVEYSDVKVPTKQQQKDAEKAEQAGEPTDNQKAVLNHFHALTGLSMSEKIGYAELARVASVGFGQGAEAGTCCANTIRSAKQVIDELAKKGRLMIERVENIKYVFLAD